MVEMKSLRFHILMYVVIDGVVDVRYSKRECDSANSARNCMREPLAIMGKVPLQSIGNTKN